MSDSHIKKIQNDGKERNGLQLDVGPFLAALEQATGRTALVLGTPEPAFFAAPIKDLGEPTGHRAMVGYDIVSDVGAAIDAGLVGVRVRTGKFRSSDLEGRFGPISSSIRSWICTTAER